MTSGPATRASDDIPRGDSNGAVAVHGTGPDLATPLRVVDAGVELLSAQARTIAQLDAASGRPAQTARIDRAEVVHALRPFTYLRVDGQTSGTWKRQISAAPCSGHMPTVDGRHVYMANVVPRLRDGTLGVLDCDATRESVLEAVRTWQSADLEEAMAEAGLPLTVVRTAEEWANHPQGRAMVGSPVVEMEHSEDAAPERLPGGHRTLDGLRVLDLTHVVAGPMVTRGLAEYGADVLHVGPADADLQDPVAVTDEMMIGKRSLHLDLKSDAGRRDIEHLVAHADVLVQSWRPGVMDRLGLHHDRLAQLRPGLIRLDISCFGPSGPWASRPGFDGNALAAIGATALEAEYGPPKLSPPGVLTDSLVGFLGVAVVNTLLHDRAHRGGTSRAHLSLARTAMWLLDLGVTAPGTAVSEDQWRPPRLRSATDEDGARLEHVDFPIDYDQRPARLNGRRPKPGSATPNWL